jgi:hypothetical protein
MRLVIGDVVYHIHFRYGRYDGRKETRAEIHADECRDSRFSTEICGADKRGVGFSWCNHQDEFVKATGRKIALSRAMTNLGLPRATRTLVWADYLNRTATPGPARVRR